MAFLNSEIFRSVNDCILTGVDIWKLDLIGIKAEVISCVDSKAMSSFFENCYTRRVDIKRHGFGERTILSFLEIDLLQ